MRTLLVLAVLLGSTVAAQAQPGQTDPVPYYAPPPVQLQLTGEQAELLAQGEVPIGRYITGGILSYVVGFGIGHAVQGRWSDQGWVYTVGESASMIAIVYGLARWSHHYNPETGRSSDRRGQNYLLGGIVGLVGFRVWEVVDAWVAPPIHNRKVRRLKRDLGLVPPPSMYGIYVAPSQTPDDSGGVAGVALNF